jgi:hypothetical protein
MSKIQTPPGRFAHVRTHTCCGRPVDAGALAVAWVLLCFVPQLVRKSEAGHYAVWCGAWRRVLVPSLSPSCPNPNPNSVDGQPVAQPTPRRQARLITQHAITATASYHAQIFIKKSRQKATASYPSSHLIFPDFFLSRTRTFV